MQISNYFTLVYAMCSVDSNMESFSHMTCLALMFLVCGIFCSQDMDITRMIISGNDTYKVELVINCSILPLVHEMTSIPEKNKRL